MKLTENERASIGLAYEYMYDAYRKAKRKRDHNKDEHEISWLKERLGQFQTGMKKLKVSFSFKSLEE
jgi:hypothetical protein